MLAILFQPEYIKFEFQVFHNCLTKNLFAICKITAAIVKSKKQRGTFADNVL